ncbi:four-helix bundle copper-binding protein [Methylobacillus gramineus]|uniref:four-helix bundle copper-binding protein n=1 Tax=Methylobacillus gramineus TaxID=755169 RepID=UPI001CFFC5B8|nr:four-helix bundle copper-binding protein [Methylobacillus gramineus]MCB5185736.1 four-helix bundle copper-binding protein [Methylobacillus gramineus]
MHNHYQPCIEALKSCIEACEHCAAACRSEGSPLHMQRCIKLDTDCAEFCRLTLNFLQRESEFADLVVEDCAEICRACGEECAGHQFDHCQQCAKACQHCLDTCLKAVAN